MTGRTTHGTQKLQCGWTTLLYAEMHVCSMRTGWCSDECTQNVPAATSLLRSPVHTNLLSMSPSAVQEAWAHRVRVRLCIPALNLLWAAPSEAEGDAEFAAGAVRCRWDGRCGCGLKRSLRRHGVAQIVSTGTMALERCPSASVAASASGWDYHYPLMRRTGTAALASASESKFGAPEGSASASESECEYAPLTTARGLTPLTSAGRICVKVKCAGDDCKREWLQRRWRARCRLSQADPIAPQSSELYQSPSAALSPVVQCDFSTLSFSYAQEEYTLK